MRRTRVFVVALVLALLGATTLLAYPAMVGTDKAERLARNFVFERMSGPDGAIFTSGKVRRLLLFPIYDPDDLLASGVLSETVGLAMQYAVMIGDRELFDQQLAFARKKLLGQFGLFYWKISHDGDLVAGTSASVDDLRIVGAALAAAKRWSVKEYALFAEDIAANIRQHETVDDALRDFLNWRDYGQPTVAETLRLSYADTASLKALVATDVSWQSVLSRTGDILLSGRSEAGLFYERYDFTTGRYEGQRQNMINQLYCALFAAELESQGHPFGEWMKRRFAEDGVLYAEYDSLSGEATKFFESTSVYALAARYAYRIGDRALGARLIDKLLKFQNLNPFSPMYGGFCDDEVYSFDNLEALISLRVHNAGQTN